MSLRSKKTDKRNYRTAKFQQKTDRQLAKINARQSGKTDRKSVRQSGKSDRTALRQETKYGKAELLTEQNMYGMEQGFAPIQNKTGLDFLSDTVGTVGSIFGGASPSTGEAQVSEKQETEPANNKNIMLYVLGGLALLLVVLVPVFMRRNKQ